MIPKGNFISQFKRVTLLASAVVMSIGCTTTRIINAELPLPPVVYYPVISDNDLLCLPDNIYSDLALKDLAQRNYILRLEPVIKSTHEKK